MCGNCGFSFSAVSVGFGGAAVAVFLLDVFFVDVFFVLVFLTAGFGGSTGAAADVASTVTGAGFFFAGSSSAKKASNKSSPIPE